MSFMPWSFEDNFESITNFSELFDAECIEQNVKVVSIMRRQDCDDFAGFEIIEGIITDKIICFELSYNKTKNKFLINNRYGNLFEFFKAVVFPDFENWVSTDDFDEWKESFE